MPSAGIISADAQNVRPARPNYIVETSRCSERNGPFTQQKGNSVFTNCCGRQVTTTTFLVTTFTTNQVFARQL